MQKAKLAPLDLPEAHKEWLKAKAKEEGETVSTIVRRLIANAYRRSGK